MLFTKSNQVLVSWRFRAGGITPLNCLNDPVSNGLLNAGIWPYRAMLVEVLGGSQVYAGKPVKTLLMHEVLDLLEDERKLVQFTNKCNGLKTAVPLSQEFSPVDLVRSILPDTTKLLQLFYSSYMQDQQYDPDQRNEVITRNPFTTALKNCCVRTYEQSAAMLVDMIDGLIFGICGNPTARCNRNILIPLYYNYGRCDYNVSATVPKDPRNILINHQDISPIRAVLGTAMDFIYFSRVGIDEILRNLHEQYDCSAVLSDLSPNFTRFVKTRFYILEQVKILCNKIADRIYNAMFSRTDLAEYLRKHECPANTHVGSLVYPMIHYLVAGNQANSDIIFRAMSFGISKDKADPNSPSAHNNPYVCTNKYILNLFGAALSSDNSIADHINQIIGGKYQLPSWYPYTLDARMTYSWKPVHGTWEYGYHVRNGSPCHLSQLVMYALGGSIKNVEPIPIPYNSVPATPELVHIWLLSVYLSSFAQFNYRVGYNVITDRNYRLDMDANRLANYIPLPRLNMVRVRKESPRLKELRVPKLEVDPYVITTINVARIS